MPLDPITEFPEQRLTNELMRISAEWQRGEPTDHSLVRLFEVLNAFGGEIECETLAREGHVRRFSDPAEGSLNRPHLSNLIAMVQDTQAELRCRVSQMAARLEAHDIARQAQACYGSVAHGGGIPGSPGVLRYTS